MSTLYARNPATVKQGDRLRQGDKRCVLLARVLYEMAVEFGSIDLRWNDPKYGTLYVELEGSWLWKDMSNWVRWDIKSGNSSATAGRVLDTYKQWNIPIAILEEEWLEIVDSYMV